MEAGEREQGAAGERKQGVAGGSSRRKEARRRVGGNEYGVRGKERI